MNRKQPRFMKPAMMFAALYLALGWVGKADAGQPLETETARLMRAGAFKVESTWEYQTSSEGTEKALPMAFEYGITDRLELAVEPVFYTAIRPKAGRHATGPGDTETTLTYLLNHEMKRVPAFAAAFEVKAPTAHNDLIGTRKTDCNATIIASKKFGKLDTHANMGYSVLGEPAGVELRGIFNLGLAGEYHMAPKIDFVAEFLAETTSSSNAGDAAGAGAVTAEAAGGDRVGMLGGRYRFSRNLVFALGVTYDNNSAFLIRPGATFVFR